MPRSTPLCDKNNRWTGLARKTKREPEEWTALLLSSHRAIVIWAGDAIRVMGSSVNSRWFGLQGFVDALSFLRFLQSFAMLRRKSTQSICTALFITRLCNVKALIATSTTLDEILIETQNRMWGFVQFQSFKSFYFPYSKEIARFVARLTFLSALSIPREINEFVKTNLNINRYRNRSTRLERRNWFQFWENSDAQTFRICQNANWCVVSLTN